MRAMALNLIKGSIDEVESKVSVTWVMSRVLDKEQLNLLKDQLVTWTDK